MAHAKPDCCCCLLLLLPFFFFFLAYKHVAEEDSQEEGIISYLALCTTIIGLVKAHDGCVNDRSAIVTTSSLVNCNMFEGGGLRN